MEKLEFIIEKRGEKWCLISKTNGEVLGTHDTEEEAKKQEEAIKANKKMSQLQNINGIEIFASGEWNGDKYSIQDLDNIVSSFHKTKDRLKPFVKLGHSDNQELLKSDELPAAGWISNIYRVGSQILADIVDMPSKIYDLVKNKAYNRISSELFVNIPVDGEVYPLALKGIALLGGETPAVNTLADIVALYGSDWKTRKIHKVEFDITKYYIVEDKQMLDELQKKNADLEAEVKQHKEKAEKAEAELKKLAEDNRIKEVDGIVAKFISDEKILPVQGPIIKELMLSFQKISPEKKFAVNSKELSTMDELVKEFISMGGVKLNTGDPTSRNEHPENAEFLEKVKKYAQEKQVPFRKALMDLWPQDEKIESEEK